MSVGGWTLSGEFSDIALTDARREAFVADCVQLMVDYGFDGIDVDWEYPVGGGLVSGRPEDTGNYTLLMEEFREQLDALGGDHPLSIAAPASLQGIANLDPAGLADSLDWINVMAYDFVGSWSDVTDLHAPLYMLAGGEEAGDGDSALWALLDAGVPASKLVLGVPYYGRAWSGVGAASGGLHQSYTGTPWGTWESGLFDYDHLTEDILTDPGYTRRWSDDALSPWLYSAAEGVMISYEDEESLGHKVDYVVTNDMGGIMFWELSADTDDHDLTGLIYDGLVAE